MTGVKHSQPDVHGVAKRAGSWCTQPTTRRQRQPSHDAGANSSSQLYHFIILNVRRLKPRTFPYKIPYIQDLLHYINQLFFAITVTWLKNHLDAELMIDDNTLFRQDCIRQRRHRRGRDCSGVAFGLRDDIASIAEPVPNFSNGAVEALGLHIKLKILLLIAMY